MGMALFIFGRIWVPSALNCKPLYYGCVDPLASDVFERDFYRPYIAGITDFNEAVFCIRH